MRRFVPLLSLAACLGLPMTAAAQGPDGAFMVPGQSLNIFISPSGQPFRAKAGEPYPVAAWFAQADTDHDGKISQAEFEADAMKFFAMVDVNHDGFLTSPENTRYETQIAPEITHTDPRIAQPHNYRDEDNTDPTGDPTRGRYQVSIQGASQYALLDDPQPMRSPDSNFDFRVSQAEWLARTDKRFTQLDANDDGFLTLDELPKTPAQAAMEEPTGKKAKKGKKGLW